MNPPYISKQEVGCSERGCFAGMFADVWHQLSSEMNFTFSMTRPKDLAWGGKLENGTWTGMIGICAPIATETYPTTSNCLHLRSTRQ